MRPLLILTLTFVYSQFSFGFTSAIKRAQARVKQQMSFNAPTPTNSICTNFTGKWQGSCEETTSEGTETYEDEMEIYQYDCGVLYIDEDAIYAGGSNTENEMSNMIGSMSHNLYDWNREQTKLTAKFYFDGKSYPTVAQKFKYSGHGDAVLFIEDGVLKSNHQSRYSFLMDGEEKTQVSSGHFSYSRVED